eukprot:gnl/TRDRNA2_/TRDRNA2_155450_c0_seq3.p1 gnl/TRDRNA2_/TRDRNA2_155450_c0~~gnl/TRDRNA2_/TRDRNA2_155450_c0_seq3.p1  ORF type:complete len:112 (-),score=0.08 gnl/TRDRNA2_/TRDRNA2_155450_c0_seq3:79-414(-)
MFLKLASGHVSQHRRSASSLLRLIDLDLPARPTAYAILQPCRARLPSAQASVPCVVPLRGHTGSSDKEHSRQIPHKSKLHIQRTIAETSPPRGCVLPIGNSGLCRHPSPLR